MEQPGTLYLVRHGESGWNRAQLVQGQSAAAPGLTEAGRAQAAAAAGYLAATAATLVLTSDLRRAVETAAPIAARLGVPLRLDRRLRERSFGVAEGRPDSVLTPAETGITGEAVTDPAARPAGGESVCQLYGRIAGLLAELLAVPGQRIVLVTHGGPVRVARACLAGLPAAGMPWQPVRSGSVLAVPAGSLRCPRRA